MRTPTRQGPETDAHTPVGYLRPAVIVALLVGAWALAAAPAANAQFPGQVGDLLALGFGDGETPVAVPAQHNAEPALVATPRAQCGPGSKREPGIQGRVPEGSATDGLTCNAQVVSHHGKSGGFRHGATSTPTVTRARSMTRRCCSR